MEASKLRSSLFSAEPSVQLPWLSPGRPPLLCEPLVFVTAVNAPSLSLPAALLCSLSPLLRSVLGQGMGHPSCLQPLSLIVPSASSHEISLLQQLLTKGETPSISRQLLLKFKELLLILEVERAIIDDIFNFEEERGYLEPSGADREEVYESSVSAEMNQFNSNQISKCSTFSGDLQEFDYRHRRGKSTRFYSNSKN